MERWQGRVALVTGASAGIGAAICRELAKHGMMVVGCARRVDEIKKIAKEFPEGALTAIRCDLGKEEDILSMFKKIQEKYGRLDVCVNNAAFSTYCPLLTGNTDEWRAMLNVNVLALSICTREAVKLMREKNIDDGQIIDISSIAAHKVISEATFYSGTKFMVRALAEGLREELKAIKSHIRVACISPGLVKTEFLQHYFPDEPDKISKIYNDVGYLSGSDIAAGVITILQTPPHVDINDIIVRPVQHHI